MSRLNLLDDSRFLRRSRVHPRRSSKLTLKICGTSSFRTVVSTIPRTPPRHSGYSTVPITRASPPMPCAFLGALNSL
eukprot:1493877-Pyramimonas_sp.AAC.1